MKSDGLKLPVQIALPVLLSLLLAACRAGGPPQGMGSRGDGPPPTPVEIGVVKEQMIEEASELIASLSARQVATLHPQVSGQITQVHVQMGSLVAAGSPLFTIDSRQQQAVVAGQAAALAAAQAAVESSRARLSQLQAERLRLQAEVDFARSQQERYTRLLAEGVIPQLQVDQSSRQLQQAEAALAAQAEEIRAQEAALVRAEQEVQRVQAEAARQQVQLRLFQVTAPFSGIVGEVLVKEGDLVTPQTVLTTLSQSQILEVNLNIPLARLPQLRLGTPVQILDQRHQVVASSQISLISPQVEAKTQSVLAKALLENPKGQWRPAQLVRARILWEKRPALLIPVTAVARVAGQTFVYIPQTLGPDPARDPSTPSQDQPPRTIAVRRPVQLGSLYGNSYEVLQGLQANEPIVVTGLQKLRDGAPILANLEQKSRQPGIPSQP